MSIRALINPATHDAEGNPGGSPTPMATTPPAQPTQSEEKTFTLEYVKSLRAEAKANREEAATFKTKLAEIETMTAAQKADAEAALAKSDKRFSDFQKALSDKAIRSEVKLGAKEHGLIDVDLLKVLDTSGFKVDEDGEVVAPEGFWDALKTTKPHFFQVTGAQTGTTSNTRGAPPPAKLSGKKASELSDEEFTRELAALTSGR
ncbi:hypothetical protein ACELLULO517_15710 [Acidisoma cellulosilytica]|uniref:Scaffolding protein n=1 Tax=Acidisoma cellulosilyticum TaxID=2802395 RepID=A0A963Z394_9PROT|nr:hypothetical protein [Acidisoma cellulosilyticum]MCB8881694.1 hypothetical protein [Acidisoma cellulosilyticum]